MARSSILNSNTAASSQEAMASKSLFLLSIHLASAWGQASTGSCLDPLASGAANKETCCSGSGTGRAVVGSVLYEYTCNSYANNYGASSLSAGSAYACAELCTQDSSCHASSWQPLTGRSGGACWLSSAGFTLTPDPYNLWVILVNTERAGHVIDMEPPVEETCDSELEQCQNDCTSEKEDLAKECNSQKEDLSKACDSDKTDLTNKCTSEKNDLTKKCTSEKDDLTKKCTSEKNDLTNKCTSEKDDLTKKCTTEKTDLIKKCTNEKDDLTKKHEQECQAKIKIETDKANKCASDLKPCQDKATPPPITAFKACNAGGNNQVLKIGNTSLKQRCHMGMLKRNMPIYRVVKTGFNGNECARICALDSRCQSALMVLSTGTAGECQLCNQNIESRLYGTADIAYIRV